MNIHGIKTRFDKLQLRHGELPPLEIIRTIISPTETIDPKALAEREDRAARKCEQLRKDHPDHPRVVKVIIDPQLPESTDRYSIWAWLIS